MIEIIIAWAIILICAIYTGRRLYKHFKTFTDKKSSIDCGGSCPGCSTTDCSDKESTRKSELNRVL